MLIQIDILILDNGLDLILVHIFHFQILIAVKLLLFLRETVVQQCILSIKNDISGLGKGPTRGFGDTTITEEAEYSTNFSKSARKIC